MQKYSEKFIEQVINHYTADPEITQAQLAKKYKLPMGTLVGWLRCKERGLTPFQRYKRNRDNELRRRWIAANERIKAVREKRNSLGEEYGLTTGTIRQLVYRKDKISV